MIFIILAICLAWGALIVLSLCHAAKRGDTLLAGGTSRAFIGGATASHSLYGVRDRILRKLSAKARDGLQPSSSPIARVSPLNGPQIPGSGVSHALVAPGADKCLAEKLSRTQSEMAPVQPEHLSGRGAGWLPGYAVESDSHPLDLALLLTVNRQVS